MSLVDRLRGAVLRWNRVGLAVVLALPFAIASILGFRWLYEQGWLLWYAVASVALYAVVRGGLAVARWRAQRNGVPEREWQGPQGEADWSPAETAAFERARTRIAQRLRKPLPWESLPAEALAVVESIAIDMSDGQRSALDFTVPEALLLVDRVALQYREFLLRTVPYSDRLSVRTMVWAWRKQETAFTAWETGFLAWRGVRLVLNPAVGVLREAERLLATGLQDRLTERVRRDMQAILLEEAAQAAVDLYSGRLKTTDTELAALAQREERATSRLAPAAEGAVTVFVVGQRGVGKSALVDALTGRSEAGGAEAGGSQTRRMESHEWDLDGLDLRLVDTPGSDGSDRADRVLAERMAAADLVLWVHRANRPGRAPDLALAEAFRKAAAGRASVPPVLHVATGADLLLRDWPRPENALTQADRAILDKAMAAIGEVMDAPPAIPVRTEDPTWNMDAVIDALSRLLPDARRHRRAKLRGVASRGAGLRGNLGRAGRGVAALTRSIRDRFRG